MIVKEARRHVVALILFVLGPIALDLYFGDIFSAIMWPVTLGLLVLLWAFTLPLVRELASHWLASRVMIETRDERSLVVVEMRYDLPSRFTWATGLTAWALACSVLALRDVLLGDHVTLFVALDTGAVTGAVLLAGYLEGRRRVRDLVTFCRARANALLTWGEDHV